MSTLIGYEIPQEYVAWLIAAGIVWLLLHWLGHQCQHDERFRIGIRLTKFDSLIGILILSYLGAAIPYSTSEDRQMRSYWGRDGVAEIFSNGDVFLDGLWHSRLTNADSHIGRPYTWMMAMAAVIAHSDEPIHDILVIGNGIGITASTLALLPDVEIDTYEVNQTLKHILADFEELTLNVAHNPKIKIYWTDARSGMALNPKQYDIIVSAPLYLNQAGSSILLSVEYFKLLKSRLKPEGVVAIYAHEGPPGQSMLVRRTVRSVFDHLQTFDDRLILTASDTPIDVTRKKLNALFKRPEPFYRQLSTYESLKDQFGGQEIWERIDRPSAPVRRGRYRITDDHPLVEYPAVARKLVAIP